MKWVYYDRDVRPVTRWISSPFIGQDSAANIFVSGNHVQFNSVGSGAVAVIVLGLKDDMIIKEWNLYVDYTSGTVTARLRRGDRAATTFTTMATITISSGGNKSETTIVVPRVDTTQHEYYMTFSHSSGTSVMYITGARLSVVEIIR